MANSHFTSDLPIAKTKVHSFNWDIDCKEGIKVFPS